jgi:hypothetical protein
MTRHRFQRIAGFDAIVCVRLSPWFLEYSSSSKQIIKIVVSQKNSKKYLNLLQNIYISLQFFRNAPKKFKFTAHIFYFGLGRSGCTRVLIKMHALAV